MNYFDQNGEDDENTEFRDQPEEIALKGGEAPPANVRSAPTQQQQRPPQPVQQAAPVQEEEVYEEEIVEEDEEADLSAILNDARLRLEQGKLYELVLQNDLFVDTGIDERAVKHVQKEIRKFAQERMEIMLGMRQEQPVQQQQVNAFPAEAFPFNSMEVEVLKSLAAAATKGASRESEAYVPETAPQAPAPKKGLSPIAGRQQAQKPAAKPLQAKPKAAVTRPAAPKPAAPGARRQNSLNAEQQRILEESGVTLEEINRQFPPDYTPLGSLPQELTPEEFEQRNLQGAMRTQKRVPSPNAVPMPTIEQTNALFEARVAQAQPAIQQNPQMQSIMSLLMNPKR